MANPYSSGGGGTHLEARVVASALTAVLCEAGFRGLPGTQAIEVYSQRAGFGDPLDDLIITGLSDSGSKTKLHLQIKRQLTFTENDTEWADVLRRAWDTFTSADFDTSTMKYGVGVGTYTARADQHYQSVLNWAAQSIDGDHFIERVEKKDFSHADKAVFVKAARSLLTSHIGRALTNDEIWRFLGNLVIIHFDFETQGSSRDAENVLDRLRGFLAPVDRRRASNIWDRLVAKAGELIPTGGAASRATLVQHLKEENLPIGSAPSYIKDIQAIERESQRALDDINTAIAGLKLYRATPRQQVTKALTESRFVQITGEPGTGKSAVLKEIAEECARVGPVFFLKDGRIQPRGWGTHAHTLGMADDLPALLREFSCGGVSILFIDGIDKISDPAVQLTVNDVLKAITTNDNLSGWRVLATVREQNLKHIETWLSQDALKKLPIKSVTVPALNRDELEVVASEIPRLRPLLSQSGAMDVVLNRPFFLNAIANLAGSGSATGLPVTEVQLLKLWWELGASDRSDFSPAQHRRNVLIDLTQRLAKAPDAAISIRNLAPEPIQELKAAGVLRDRELGHSVDFVHDIYEEWALCELLLGEQSRLAAYLGEVGQPQALVRPVQLLGAYVLETTGTADGWQDLMEKTGDQALRPVWQRAILSSCFQSTATVQLLDKISSVLLGNGAELLKRLLLAISTLEVIPNPIFLDEKRFPDLAPDERVRYAHYSALPKPTIWVRFLDWLVPRLNSVPADLVPELVPVLAVWQGNYSGHNVRHCREIGVWSHRWLLEVEAAFHPKKWQDRGNPFGRDFRHRDEEEIEKGLRKLFLSSAGDIPDLAIAYLQEKSHHSRRRDNHSAEIIPNSGALVRHLPAALVDYMLAVLLEELNDYKDHWGGYGRALWDELGVSGRHEFYPASPIQMPFLVLLRNHEEEGLRLIKAICNHATSTWRWCRANPDSRDQIPLTALPIHLSFSWGNQDFWGDHHVYAWYRSVLANSAVGSALMALEQWALERIEGGGDFDETFRKVAEGNESVAALGIGVSLCLAFQTKSRNVAFQLVTCPHLWEWDIARSVGDSQSLQANEMGDWQRYRVQLTAVRELNARPHRKQDLRSLIFPIWLFGDATLKQAYEQRIRDFPKQLPFIYEEQKNYPDYIDELREQMERFAEQADPRYFKAAHTPDGQHFQVWSEPPSIKQPEAQARLQEHARLNEYAALVIAASMTLDEGKLPEGFAVAQALAKGKEYDDPALFDEQDVPHSFLERQRMAAVTGAAFVVARYCDDRAWNDDVGLWCIDVLGRAASGAEESDSLSMRGSILTFHPAVFAAHGLSALLARGYAVDRCREAILSLAVDPLEGVVSAVFDGAWQYAAQYPEFYWTLLDLGLRQCIVSRGEVPEYHSIYWDDIEGVRQLGLLERAENLLKENRIGDFPDIPMPWVKSLGTVLRGGRDTKGYRPNDVLFMYHLAPKVLFKASLDPILSGPDLRRRFLGLVAQLTEYTIQEIIPPFVQSRREYREHRVPYEWVYGFALWCGKVGARLTAEEFRETVLQRVFGSDNETALKIMQSMMRSFMIDALLLPKEISEEHQKIWSEMTAWVFDNPEWKGGPHQEHLDREFFSCGLSVLFCAAPDFSPVICGVEPGWQHWSKFRATIERGVREFGMHKDLFLAVAALLKGGGIDLMPEPALAWLRDIVVARKRDLAFWDANGDGAVDVVKALMDKKSATLTADQRESVTLIADILVDNGVRGAGFFQQELLRAS